jgi:Trk-type K+ transport system membrane component
MSLPTAAYSGVFHSISAFNNAGFSIYADNLMGFASDPLVLLPISLAVIVGGLGFYVVLELRHALWQPRRWSVVTRVTVVMTLGLLIGGTVIIGFAELRNPATLGALHPVDRLVGAFVAAVMPRTAGFNAIDVAAMRPESLFTTDVLMFIGGGSAGTAGGIKVTTAGLLLAAVWSEIRGRRDVEIGYRRIPESQQRQALAVVTLSALVLGVFTFAVLSVTDVALGAVTFEVVSAFGTVGLSTGITADLPVAAKAMLVALMFIGRLGPLAFATALARRDRVSKRQLPEEGLTIG